jgi:hypothetical protein
MLNTINPHSNMKYHLPISLLPLLCALVLPLTALATEEKAAQPGPAASLVFGLLPFALMGGLLWWYLRRSQQSPFMRRSLEYYERSEQHMQKMEQIGERIAAALEEQDKDGVPEEPPSVS